MKNYIKPQTTVVKFSTNDICIPITSDSHITDGSGILSRESDCTEWDDDDDYHYSVWNDDEENNY